MNDVLCKVIWYQLQSIGLFIEEKTYINEQKIISGVSNLYDRWLEETIAIFERNNYLTYDGEICIVKHPLTINQEMAWKEWNTLKDKLLEDTDQRANIILLDTTLRVLPEILTGIKAATDVIFPDSSMELVEGIYKNNSASDYFNDVLSSSILSYVKERINHDLDTKISILEIGAGTGSTSEAVFTKLEPYHDYIKEYCYTDISKAFLMHAEKEYASANPFLTYKILNIEEPITLQEVEAGTYDIIIAANVLHATRNIKQTLRNAKIALKSNGLIFLNEISNNSVFTHLTFGLLEGWWLYDDADLRIPGCPGLYSETWKKVLEEEGYRSVLFPAKLGHDLGQQIIIAESDGIVRRNENIKINAQLELNTQNKVPNQIRSVKSKKRPAKSANVTKKINSSRIVVTDKMVNDHVRMIIKESIAESLKMDEYLIKDDQSFSEYGVDSIIAVNLINLINKQIDITLQTTVLFDYNNVNNLCRHITDIYKSNVIALLQEEIDACVEEEIDDSYWEEINAELHKEISYPISEKSTIGSTYKRVIIERPGTVNDLRVIESSVPELKEREVQVAVSAFSLNFGDLLCVRGLYPTMPPYPFSPGFEASGTVIRVGSAVTSVYPGDEIIVGMGEDFGGQANLITCLEEQVFQKPKNLTFEEACALPTVGITMMDAFKKAQLKKGERILIQTATGGTGLVAVQLAKYYGAEIYATAGSKNKLDYLDRLGVHHRINYLEEDFETEIIRLTNGSGVDVVINTLAGDAMQKGINCLSPGGRYIEIAMTAIKSAKSIDLSVLNNNQTIYSVDLRKLTLERPEIVSEYRSEMVGLIESGVIYPTISRIFTFADIKKAYAYLEKRENIGKIIVSIPEQDQYKGKKINEPKEEAFKRESYDLNKEPIAIIGMSGRFAKSQTLDQLWEHLANGTNLIQEVTRWDLEKYHNQANKNCNYGSFLDDIDKFDPAFFNISGVEAKYMDPQQRLFLEESWKAFEDAGYTGESIKKSKSGVYVGCCGGDYQMLFGEKSPAQAFWGNHNSVIPARIAYLLDLQGPAIAIDTACSSSLVAIHLACQSLWTKEVDMALAGGVFVQTTPGFYLSSNKAGMLSPTGRCSTFDQAADGFVPGEGVGAVVLKRLSKAIEDGDHIYGVIRGSGTNQDGTTNGITAPSAISQERLEREVYSSFNINPEEIQMVEAHGTGTILGDPIEFSALSNSFRKFTQKKEYCALGSIKTNLGHTAAAAGVASVIKILLSLKNEKIPPLLNFKSGNSRIQFTDSPFYINTNCKDWNVKPNSQRLAAVSAFGFSGTNAHLVIGDSPKEERTHLKEPGYLIVLSARNAQQLQQQVVQLVDYCEMNPEGDCGNISYTLLQGRKHFNYRLACVVRSINELAMLLKKWLDKGKLSQVYTSNLQENIREEQIALKRYGNECLRNCRNIKDGNEYLENLSTIAELYVQGYVLEFKNLFTKGQYLRVSLPKYPFARDIYWVTEEEKDTTKLKVDTDKTSITQSINLIESVKNDIPSKAVKQTTTKTLEESKQIVLQSISDVQVQSKESRDLIEPIALQSVSDSESLNGFDKGLSSNWDELLQEELKKSLADILCIKANEIDVNTKFIEMGLDSIIGVEWIQFINKKYGTSIQANIAYEYPTLSEFVQYLKVEIENQNDKSLLTPNNLESSSNLVTLQIITDNSVVHEKDVEVEEYAEQQSLSVDDLKEELISSLSTILCVKKSDIDVNKKFIEMGLDSIIGVEWVQSINKKYGISIQANTAYEYPTIGEFAEVLIRQISNKDDKEDEKPNDSTVDLVVEKGEVSAEVQIDYKDTYLDQEINEIDGLVPMEDQTELIKVKKYNIDSNESSQYPELVHLNKVTKGKPVFWIHAGLGGVDIYYPIALKSKRPFYGIKPRGWYDEEDPMCGIEAMASYYIEIIRSVQSEGPYDLGGYSFGGNLSYEITRQLQDAGQSVNSIVMLDTFDSVGTQNIVIPDSYFNKNIAFQIVNMALFTSVFDTPEKLFEIGIHAEEVNIDVSDEEFLNQLIKLAKKRGLTQTEDGLYNTIQRTIKVQEAYQINKMSVLPLSNPDEVSCYYLRNKNGLFLSEFHPYLSIKEDLYLADNLTYWKEWENNISKLKIIDLDCISHMTMLSEPEVCEKISDFCGTLYSDSQAKELIKEQKIK